MSTTQYSHSCGAQLVIGALIIGPWIALLLYDLVLYILRAVSYEIPYVGGRARGKARPRAPSLTERPSGNRRKFSLARRDRPILNTGGGKADPHDVRYRHLVEEQDDSSSAS
ncbi:hypothetical protein T440DRAFT_466529 [Plenodomus tracheiphilus IPT5]|uniref:Uncharacterized protein n=1 Tax=Plenodomus tracheiphilus IPT5 TaxID=1408161 RepID=A0A6A7BE28_9PLEO|nr:hypothetical protein T440DRAFT_466529 [Plenodomus tracheiphilus IPT5]